MSLIAWYPLNGDLKNLGISDMDLTISTNPTYVNGKIGKCALGGRYALSVSSVNRVFNNSAMSITFWFNNNAVNNNHAICGFSGNGEGDSGATRSWDFFQYPTKNDFHWSMGTLGGGIKTGAFPDNTWVHVCITYENNTTTIYLNGSSIYTNTSASSNFTFNTKYYISIVNNAHLLNDFRIYNHCLSPKEVKEISKGLVLHYPLNLIDGYIGGRNLARDTSNEWKLLGSPTGSTNLCYNISRIYTNGLNVGDKVTISLDYKYENITTSSGQTGFASLLSAGDVTGWTSGAISSRIITNPSGSGETHLKYTFTVDNNHIKNSFWPANIRHDYLTGKVYIKNLVAVKYPNELPWTPAPEDVNYDNVVYDCSGYGNNGTIKGTLTADFDTPVGLCSTRLKPGSTADSPNTDSDASYIKNTTLNLVTPNLITVSWWGKVNSYGRGGIFETYDTNGNNNYSQVAIANWDSTFGIYNGSTRINYYSYIKSSNWLLNAITFDGVNAKCYINGELKSTNPLTGTLPTIKGFVIGLGKAGGLNRKTDQNISDFRIYTTALSDSDIKELYQTRFVVTDNNTMLATEYVENDSVKFNSTGVLNSPNLMETVPIYDMITKTLSDGSKWARIFYHNNQGGTKMFKWTDDFVNLAVIHDSDRYSRLNLLKDFKFDGVFELMACQPDDGNGVWRWTQTNNPVTSSTAGTVKGVNGYSYDSGGLMRCTGNTWIAHTSSSGNWWCAVGCCNKYGAGIPGWGGLSIAGSLELWVRIYNTDKVSIYKDNITIKELIEK